MPIGNFTRAVPVICTADVEGTVRWFERTLGFQRDWSYGEPPVYAGMKAGSAVVYVCDDAETASAIKEKGLSPDVFLWVTDIDSVYAQHRANGAEIVEDLAPRPWGVRQYGIREPNGYTLKIAATL
ncbi:MAG: VOC family protein [Acidobacteriota bacterium]